MYNPHKLTSHKCRHVGPQIAGDYYYRSQYIPAGGKKLRKKLSNRRFRRWAKLNPEDGPQVIHYDLWV